MGFLPKKDVRPKLRYGEYEEGRDERFLSLRLDVNPYRKTQFLTEERAHELEKSFAFANRKSFATIPYGIVKLTIDDILLNNSKKTDNIKIQINHYLAWNSEDLFKGAEFACPSLHFVVDLTAKELYGQKGVPIGLERLALFSFKCFGVKLKKMPDFYPGLLEQLKPNIGKEYLAFVRHKMVLKKDKKGLAEYNDNGEPIIMREAEIFDFSSVDDEEFKAKDNGLPYIVELSNNDKLIIEKSKVWKK